VPLDAVAGLWPLLVGVRRLRNSEVMLMECKNVCAEQSDTIPYLFSVREGAENSAVVEKVQEGRK